MKFFCCGQISFPVVKLVELIPEWVTRAQITCEINICQLVQMRSRPFSRRLSRPLVTNFDWWWNHRCIAVLWALAMKLEYSECVIFIFDKGGALHFEDLITSVAFNFFVHFLQLVFRLSWTDYICRPITSSLSCMTLLFWTSLVFWAPCVFLWVLSLSMVVSCSVGLHGL